MIDLEKLVDEHPNDFHLGGEIRKIVNEEQIVEETNWKDMYLRMAAEFDNYKKRTNKDKNDLVLKTKTSLLEPILDIDSEISIASKHINNEGVNLIIQKLEKFLLSQGIKTIQTDTYDENLHEVISIVNTPNKGIIDVSSKGYSIGDKIIRYPKIILSK